MAEGLAVESGVAGGAVALGVGDWVGGRGVTLGRGTVALGVAVKAVAEGGIDVKVGVADGAAEGEAD